MLTLEALKQAKESQEAQRVAKPKLSDFVGKQVITALPGARAYEAQLRAVITTEDQLILHVTTTDPSYPGTYSVTIRANQFFEDQINPLFHQLNLPVIDFEALSKLIGAQFLIAAVDSLKDGKIYTNYRFDTNSIKNLIPIDEPAENIENI